DNAERARAPESGGIVRNRRFDRPTEYGTIAAIAARPLPGAARGRIGATSPAGDGDRAGKHMGKGASTSGDSVTKVAQSPFKGTTFQVRDFWARESVGRPFHVEVQLVAENTDLAFATALGDHLTLEIELEKAGDPRYLDGIVTEFAYIG